MWIGCVMSAVTVSFCPYSSAPYKDKFYSILPVGKDFEDSTNQGFVVVSEEPLTVRVRLGHR